MYVVKQLQMVQHLGVVIKWAKLNGCEWDSNVYNEAAANGPTFRGSYKMG